MDERYTRLSGAFFLILFLTNLLSIAIILDINSYKPILIEIIGFVILIGVLIISIFYYLYEIFLLIFVYDRFKDTELIKMNNLYALIVGWLFTFIILLILLRVYKFF